MQETSRRLLHFSVPRVVAVSPHMRLVEDNPASLSLLDIYKQVTDHYASPLNGMLTVCLIVRPSVRPLFCMTFCTVSQKRSPVNQMSFTRYTLEHLSLPTEGMHHVKKSQKS